MSQSDSQGATQGEAVEEAPWYKTATVYQIYPKSFRDTTGSGTGDLAGVTSSLSYIRQLGAEVIWLTPVYRSPQRDNGYDISDYYNIDPSYGSMADFEHLLNEAHALDLKVVMDMVVNHTSTEHEWFQEARTSRDNPYRDYYIWRDPAPDGGPPTNWESKFGGPAWEFDGTTGQYYLHLFDVSQADLNWENPALRDAVHEMMRWWFRKGVDGFRLDVINLISKDQDFPQAPPETDGRQFYTDGPRIHEFLKEMRQQAFQGDERLTVGEMSSTTVENCVAYTREDSRELAMTFSFHHLKVDYPLGEKWTDARFDLLALKDVISHWQIGMAEGGGWNALFWCNHDQPRVVSRFGDDGPEFRVKSAKMLAAVMHLLQGTPYIYQGEEIGMTNPNFQAISDYRDVESLNIHRTLLEKGIEEPEVLAILGKKSRDNSRTPMQWTSDRHGGFTTGNPWIDTSGNELAVNAAAAVADLNSVYWFYRDLIQLRKSMPLITTGRYELHAREHPAVFAYWRHGKGESLLVLANFYGTDAHLPVPEAAASFRSCVLLLGNEDGGPIRVSDEYRLRPYEVAVLHLSNSDPADRSRL
jgi:trehalose-6-phosphate hydrolase